MTNATKLGIAGLTAAMLSVAGSVLDADAQTPPARLIPFQARLTNVSNQAVSDGVYALTFNIYDQSEAGETCWTEVHQNVSVINGQINVILGAITSLDNPHGNNPAQAINFNPTSGTSCTPTAMTSCQCQGRGQRYLGITIGSNPLEMVPRHQLVPSFHARRADIADAVKDGGVITSMLADSAVTTDKIAGNSITATKLSSSLEIAAFVDGSIKGADITSVNADGITSTNVKDGSIKGADVTAIDADGLTGANIKDGAIQDQDLATLPYVRVYTSADSAPISQNGFLILSFDLERDDIAGTPGMHCKPGDIPGDPTCTTQPTSRLVAPRSGVYLIGADARFLGDCNECALSFRVTKTDATTRVIAFDRPVGAGTMSAISLTTAYRLSAGEYVEVAVNAGSTDGVGGPVRAVVGLSSGFQGMPATAFEYSPVFWMTLVR